jgi:GAF domain-containing protein
MRDEPHMTVPHGTLSLAAGLKHVGVPIRDLWVGVAGLGGDLSELEIEAYALGVLDPDTYSHNLIAQALNEESLAAGFDHPVAYAKGDTVTTEPTGSTREADLDFADTFDDMDPRTWSTLDKLSRALHVRNHDLQPTLEAVLRSACDLVAGADAAGLNLYVRGRFEPQAVLGEAPHELDLLQQASGVGPCIDASREQATIHVVDMQAETRWPDFAARAVELGVLSMLCVPLWVDELRLGSLSLYATTTAAFDDPAQNLAGLLATHAALALADAQRVEHLRQALVNRDTIGQAKGILMALHRITADQAFERLSVASQALNVKLARLAEIVAATGELPSR